MESLKKQCKSEVSPYKNFDELSVGRHTVKKFSFVKTDYGDRVRVDMGTFQMYLPERFSLKPIEVKELNRSPKVMVFGGKDKTRNNRLILDFEDEKKPVPRKRKSPLAPIAVTKKRATKNAPCASKAKKNRKGDDENKKKKKTPARATVQPEVESEVEFSSEDESSDEGDTFSSDE